MSCLPGLKYEKNEKSKEAIRAKTLYVHAVLAHGWVPSAMLTI